MVSAIRERGKLRNTTLYSHISAAVNEVLLTLVEAGIKSITKRNVQHQLMNVWANWITISKFKNRNSFKENFRRLCQGSLEELWDIGAPEAIETIQKFVYSR